MTEEHRSKAGNTITTREMVDGRFEGAINGDVCCYTARRSTARAIAEGLDERRSETS